MEKNLNEIFEHLHHHPEIRRQEVETTQFIAEQFIQAGLTPVLFEGMTGLYVDIGPGIPKVGFRTDIDALWQEVDGVFKANHSCGHDGHMTIALGVAFALQKMNLSSAVRIIFQPKRGKGSRCEGDCGARHSRSVAVFIWHPCTSACGTGRRLSCTALSWGSQTH